MPVAPGPRRLPSCSVASPTMTANKASAGGRHDECNDCVDFGEMQNAGDEHDEPQRGQ